MKILKNKIAAIAIALFLTLSMMLVTLPTSNAQTKTTVTTKSYVQASPNPIGVGQTAYIIGQVYPSVPARLPNGTSVLLLNHGYTLTITDPDGKKTTLGPVNSNSGSYWFWYYTPATVGNYSVVFNYPGEVYDIAPYQYTYSASNATTTLTVQEEPLSYIPNVPLPTNYWTTPVQSNDRLWTTITGNWLFNNYAPDGWPSDGRSISTASVRGWNPYSAAVLAPHIMWTKPIGLGGLVGGNSGVQTYVEQSTTEVMIKPPVIMDGYLYYNEHSSQTPGETGFVCVDLRTGQQIFNNPNYTITTGQEWSYISSDRGGVIPLLWNLGSSYQVFDASSGNLLETFSGSLAPTAFEFGSDGTLYTYYLNAAKGYMIRWNSTKAFQANGIIGAANAFGETGSPTFTPGTYNWASGIDYNTTSTPQPNFAAASQLITAGFTAGVLMQHASTSYSSSITTEVAAYHVIDGTMAWTLNFTNPLPYNNDAAGNGTFAYFNQFTNQWDAYSATTGEHLWSTTPIPSLYSTYVGTSQVVANNVFYVGTYAGYLRAYNWTTGALLWQFYMGDPGLDLNYPGYTPYNGPVLADGVIYDGFGSRTAYDPAPLGAKFFAINATTGTQIWNISGRMYPMAIANGYLVTVNWYDNQIYVFGMGPSATTVTAPQVGVTTGSPITITGTVTDASLGGKEDLSGTLTSQIPLKGTPVISDSSMTQWMQYWYQQQPMPTDATGVPVTLSVIDSNGNFRQIGTTTTNALGTFGYSWAPDIPGNYTITASFAGSNSYYGSSAQTYFYASLPATSAPIATAVTGYATTNDLMYGIVAIIIVIIIIGAAILTVLMRKRP